MFPRYDRPSLAIQRSNSTVSICCERCCCIAFDRKLITELRRVTCHIVLHVVSCYRTQVNAPRLTTIQIGRCSIFLLWRYRRLSCWLVVQHVCNEWKQMEFGSKHYNVCLWRSFGRSTVLCCCLSRRPAPADIFFFCIDRLSPSSRRVGGRFVYHRRRPLRQRRNNMEND